MNALDAIGVACDEVSVGAALVTPECQSITEIAADCRKWSWRLRWLWRATKVWEVGRSKFCRSRRGPGQRCDVPLRYIAPQSDTESNGAFHVNAQHVVLSSERKKRQSSMLVFFFLKLVEINCLNSTQRCFYYFLELSSLYSSVFPTVKFFLPGSLENIGMEFHCICFQVEYLGYSKKYLILRVHIKCNHN